MGETKQGATLADAVGFVIKADLEAAEARAVAAERDARALVQEAEGRAVAAERQMQHANQKISEMNLIVEGLRDLLAEREAALAALVQERNLAVTEACKAKAAQLAQGRRTADAEQAMEDLGRLVEELDREKSALWDKLKVREERAVAPQVVVEEAAPAAAQ